MFRPSEVILLASQRAFVFRVLPMRSSVPMQMISMDVDIQSPQLSKGQVVITASFSLDGKKSLLPMKQFTLCATLSLFLLAKPPFQIFFSFFPSLVLFRFKGGPQFCTQLHEFLMRNRQPATYAHIAFRN